MVGIAHHISKTLDHSLVENGLTNNRFGWGGKKILLRTTTLEVKFKNWEKIVNFRNKSISVGGNQLALSCFIIRKLLLGNCLFRL